MEAAIIWDKFREKASLSEFEIHTIPKNKSIPLWFVVDVTDLHLVIKKAKLHTPSIKISMDRMITFKDFEFVYQFYDRWSMGDTTSRQDAPKSHKTRPIYLH